MGTYWHPTQIVWLKLQKTSVNFPQPPTGAASSHSADPQREEGAAHSPPQPLTANNKGVLLGGPLSCVRACRPLKATLGGRQPWGATHKP